MQRIHPTWPQFTLRLSTALLLLVVAPRVALGQQRPAQANLPEPKNWTAQQDHRT